MHSGAGRMVQWLRTLVALTEDLGSVPNTHTVGHTHLQLQFPWI